MGGYSAGTGTASCAESRANESIVISRCWLRFVEGRKRRKERDFGTVMAAQKTKMTGAMLPLPLQFMAAWLGGWLGRVLQVSIAKTPFVANDVAVTSVARER